MNSDFTVAKSKERLKSSFPDRLKELRLAIGASQDMIARALGVSRAAIGYYESGERMPDIAFLDALCGLTGCNVDFLLGKTETMSSPPASIADIFTLNDKQLENLYLLLDMPSFADFMMYDDVVRFFSWLDVCCSLNSYGNSDYARSLIELRASNVLCNIVGSIYIDCCKFNDRMDGPSDDSLLKSSTAPMDEAWIIITNKLDDLKAKENQIIIDAHQWARKNHEQEDQERLADPIAVFRHKLGEVDYAKKTRE